MAEVRWWLIESANIIHINGTWHQTGLLWLLNNAVATSQVQSDLKPCKGKRMGHWSPNQGYWFTRSTHYISSVYMSRGESAADGQLGMTSSAQPYRTVCCRKIDEGTSFYETLHIIMYRSGETGDQFMRLIDPFTTNSFNILWFCEAHVSICSVITNAFIQRVVFIMLTEWFGPYGLLALSLIINAT